MKSFSPALVVMLVGVAVMLAAGVAWAAWPPSYSPHIIPMNAKKAPPPPKQERGLLVCIHAESPTAGCFRVRTLSATSGLVP